MFSARGGADGQGVKAEAIVVVPQLPKTRSGKVMRRVARAAYLGTDPGDLSALEDPLAVEAIRKVRGNRGVDCVDWTDGSGTSGTADEWVGNLGFESMPAGICSRRR